MPNFDSVTPPKFIPPRVHSELGPIKIPNSHKPSNAPYLKAKKPKRILKSILALIVVIILILGGVVAIRAANLSDKIFVGQKISFFQKIQLAIRGSFGGETLIGEKLGQINILLLGIGGEGHDGPYLTDTIILAQIRPDIGQVVLTSIPRDYLAELPNNLGQRKINAAFAEGFNRNKSFKEAGDWAIGAVEKISGLDIPYFAVVDFQGFEKAINLVSGLDVQIDKTFTDSEYPANNLDYLPPITFKQGMEHMDGARALEFARSRHGNNGEGSDFARSIRQQKVISTLKSKILSLNLVTDAGTINRLLGTFADHFHTNIGPGEMFQLFKIVKEKNIQNFYSTSLDQETGLICSKILEGNGAWVLVPCSGKTNLDIVNFFKNSFAIGKMKSENSVIWMATSTGDKTAYQEAYTKLKNAGLMVWEVGFDKPSFSTNMVYQVNPKPATLEYVKNSLSATEVTLPPPGIKIDSAKVDIIVILGGDN